MWIWGKGYHYVMFPCKVVFPHLISCLYRESLQILYLWYIEWGSLSSKFAHKDVAFMSLLPHWNGQIHSDREGGGRGKSPSMVFMCLVWYVISLRVLASKGLDVDTWCWQCRLLSSWQVGAVLNEQLLQEVKELLSSPDEHLSKLTRLHSLLRCLYLDSTQ